MLALSDESDDKVAEYIDKMGLTIRVAAGFTGNGDWGVKSLPSAALINSKGEITWSGYPGDLSKGKIKDALKGVRPSKGGYLSLVINDELPRELKKAVDEAADGELGKALAKAKELAADEKSEPPVREAAELVAQKVLEHAELLRTQAEGFIEKASILQGIEVLEEIADAMKGTEVAGQIAERLGEIEKDEALQREIEAEEALVKALEAADKRGFKKSLKKFEAVSEKYPGTRAASRAEKKIRANK